MISSRERGWPWQSCNRAGAGCGGSCQAGQAGSSLAGRMASQAAFPYGSKLRRPQGFHNPGNGPARRAGGGEEGLARPFTAPHQGLHASLHVPSPVLGGGPAMVPGQGVLSTPAPPQDRSLSRKAPSHPLPQPPHTSHCLDSPPFPQRPLLLATLYSFSPQLGSSWLPPTLEKAIASACAPLSSLPVFAYAVPSDCPPEFLCILPDSSKG